MVIKNPRITSSILVLVFEHEKSLTHPGITVVQDLYKNKKLPIGVKRVIETLYGELI